MNDDLSRAGLRYLQDDATRLHGDQSDVASLMPSVPTASEFRQVQSVERVVQDRPTLGTTPQTRRGAWWWLQVAVDLLSGCAALAIVTVATGASAFPALPVTPVLLIAAYALLGLYGSHPPRGVLAREDGLAWPMLRLLLAAFFAWSSSLMIPLEAGDQIALWVAFVVLDTAARGIAAPLTARATHIERWMVVGDESIAERLAAFTPLRERAIIVGVIEPGSVGNHAELSAALEAVDRLHPTRVIIASHHGDEEGLKEIIYAFKSLGVAVSVLPRPLNLLEANNVTAASQVAGVPLINVDALLSGEALPHRGADRRRERQTKISVVIPALNEAANIGKVLGALPPDLHEVILVDGNSRDGTIDAARRVLPDIKVVVQKGRGKGDAFRVGFAAVTGNLIVMLDADGSADPAEIERYVEALEGGADFAKGSRFLDGGGSADITASRRLGNAALSNTCNMLQGTRFTDLCYGYNAFWTRCLPFISLDVPGFEVETLINLRVASAGMRIVEVPSFEHPRISGQSNLKIFRDGFRVLGTILVETRRIRAIDRHHPYTRRRDAARTHSHD